MIIERYLVRHIAFAGGSVLLVLLILFSFLALTDALDDVGKGAYTSADAFAVVLLTLPALVVDLLPITCLLGTLLGLGMLANHHELTAVRASGMPTWRLAQVVAGLALAMMLLALCLQFLLVPACERQAQEFRSRTVEQTARGDASFWSRRDHRIIRVGEVAFGSIPRDIELYELDAQAHLRRFVRAAKADILSSRQWLLHDVEEKRVEGDQVYYRRVPTLQWESFLSPDQVATLVAPMHALSPADLYRYLRESADSGIDLREHQTRFWRHVSLPLTLVGMSLLGVPLVMLSLRSRAPGLRAVVGAGIGIAFYLFEQVASQLALLFDLPPAATSLLPAVLVTSLAVFAIARLARGTTA